VRHLRSVLQGRAQAQATQPQPQAHAPRRRLRLGRRTPTLRSKRAGPAVCRRWGPLACFSPTLAGADRPPPPPRAPRPAPRRPPAWTPSSPRSAPGRCAAGRPRGAPGVPPCGQGALLRRERGARARGARRHPVPHVQTVQVIFERSTSILSWRRDATPVGQPRLGIDVRPSSGGTSGSASAADDGPRYRAPETRQTVLPTSSATSSAPFESIATPTGRPMALPSRSRNPVSTSTGGPEGVPPVKGTKITL
jgi:hypothetical protein